MTVNWRRIAPCLKGLAAVLCAWAAFWLMNLVPVWHSDAELDTIGRITYHGVPFPWLETAPGYAHGIIKLWILPLNLAFWAVLSCLVWRVRTCRGWLLCMAVAEAPVLLLVLLVYV